MADDKTRVGGQDRARINLNEDYEVTDWTRTLGVTRDRLREPWTPSATVPTMFANG